MRNNTQLLKPLLAVIILALSNSVFGQARLLRFPTVHNNQVVFSYAGDLYTVATSGGVARKLTTHDGYEMFAKFSPDGKTIAFTGQYQGNTEVFTMPANGGTPKRLTYTPTLGRDDIADRMGPNNIVLAWHPQGQKVMFRSRMQSFNSFKGAIFSADTAVSLPVQLPFSVAGWCSYNAQGTQLAYNRTMREFRTWKYYQGGMADDIWIFDFETQKSINITNNDAQDVMPMWHGDKIYYISDRDRTMNLFSYNTKTKQTNKETNFTDYDIKFPSLGNKAIVFEKGGYLFTFDLETGQTTQINITIADDFAAATNKLVHPKDFISSACISPDGARVAVSGRGDIITLPVESGVWRNLTKSSGAHDKYVAWSPSGAYLAWVSDKTGEDEIYIQKQDGSAPARQLTTTGAPYKYGPEWSPNSKYLLYADRGQKLNLIEVETGDTTTVFKSNQWEVRSFVWGPKSKYIAFIKPNIRKASTLCIYDIDTKKTHDVTTGWYDASSPAFSPDGKYLFFVSSRTFKPLYSNTEWNHAYRDMSKIYAVLLANDTPNPFAPDNNEVAVKKDDDEDKKSKNKKQKDDQIKIDFDNISSRVVELPIDAGNYANLQTVDSKIYYYYGQTGQKAKLKFFDVSQKKETELGDYSSYQIAANGKKVLFVKGGYYVEDLPTSKIKLQTKLNTQAPVIQVDLIAEYQQIFNEAWRQMRDYFYDPGMHGVDWPAIKQKYAPLVPHVRHRTDLSYIIGEMIGELNVGHAYIGGGDRQQPERIYTGLLGAQLTKHSSGYFKIENILPGLVWDNNHYSPLAQPGSQIKQGSYIIKINGSSVKNLASPYQLTTGLAGQLAEVTYNTQPQEEGAKTQVIKLLKDESDLYYHNWVEANRKKVAEATNGRVGYLHIPDMVQNGLNQFARYFYAQLDKEALIIDDRGNGGGNVSPMIIERLRREIGLWAVARNGEPYSKPGAMLAGPMVCLIDRYSASDGDLFPYQFKHYKLGPLIGERSWGGVVGIRGSLPFIDGADLRKPEFSHFAPDGSDWIIEGYGVDPDIEVVNDPHEEYKGNDAQLQRAITEIMKMLENGKGITTPKIPDYPDKSK